MTTTTTTRRAFWASVAAKAAKEKQFFQDGLDAQGRELDSARTVARDAYLDALAVYAKTRTADALAAMAPLKAADRAATDAWTMYALSTQGTRVTRARAVQAARAAK